jgi:hypothetical protein
MDLAKDEDPTEYHSLIGKIMSYIYSAEERKVLDATIRFLCDNGFVGHVEDEKNAWLDLVSAHDGVMVKHHDGLASRLQDLQAYVHNITGYSLRFKIKPMDEGWDDVPDYVEYDLPTDDMAQKVESDVQAAKILINRMGNDLVKDEDGIVYARPPGTPIWRSDEKEVKMIMAQACFRLNIEKVVSKTDLLKFRAGEEDAFSVVYSRNSAGAKAIINTAWAILERTSGFKQKLYDSNLRKLVFTNGYIDYSLDHVNAAGETVPWKFVRGFDGVESLACVPWDFPEGGETPEIRAVRQQLEERVMDKIWGDGDIKNAHARFTSRALAGNPEDKTWAILRGKRNTGKGVFELLAKISFGSRYVGSFNLESLKQTDKEDGGDEAKKNSWMIKFRYNRLGFSNEGGVKTVNSNMVKKVTSGGDDIQVRCNYVDEFCIQIQARPMCNLNHFPGFTTDDGMDFLHVFPMTRQFISQKQKDTDQYRNRANYLVKDDGIKTWIRRTEFVPQAYLFYLLSQYSRTVDPPLEEMVAAKADILKDEDDNVWFEKMFRVTDNPSHFVPATSIKKVCEGTNYNVVSIRQEVALYRDGDPKDFRSDRPVGSRNGVRGIRGLKLTNEGHERVNGTHRMEEE